MQKTTALSAVESEYYRVGVDGGYGGALPPQPARKMGFAQDNPTPLYEDNTACIKWGNKVIGGRERAILTFGHFAHDVMQNGQMKF
jgi:hypothetical protein